MCFFVSPVVSAMLCWHAGMMQAPDVMYGDPNGMMGGPGGIGAQARLYHAGGKGGAGGGAGGRGGPDKAAAGSDVPGDVMGSGGQLPGAGHYVQVMDPEGKVYYLPQGQQ